MYVTLTQDIHNPQRILEIIFNNFHKFCNPWVDLATEISELGRQVYDITDETPPV